jgi:WD40 repeat protein/DNA-binding SARP family transcriptional activator
VGVKVLGRLQVDGVGGNGIALGPRDRIVLEALALGRGEVVSNDRLADALWGDDAPATWPKVVQGCVMRLRKALGPDAVETTGGGYRLAIAPDDLDSVVFERLVERGRTLAATGEVERAAVTFARALSLWRGAPFAHLERWSPGRTEAARLDELRRTTEEDLLDARLAAGEHREVVAEAQARVSEDPLRERRWATLALAEYRCGRQGDALRSLRRARRTLVEELGVDPGAELVALENAILRQDAELSATTAAVAISAGCPYKGLAFYDVGDADSFFGRDAQVAACVERLATTPLLVIAGPSGCGKSSLLRAGVVPAVQRAGRPVAVFTPGADPHGAMATAVAPNAEAAVVVVDQFEELFTLSESTAAARAFCTRLGAYARETAPVIIAVRADHLAQVVADEPFARLVERGLHLVTSLSGNDLRQAIEGPATQAGLRLEHGLVDLLVRDTDGEPGAMPLLSHALAETWSRRDGRVLTVEGYRATGGIRGAVARSADRLYESLPEEQRSMVRSVLLRLVAPAIDGEPVRSRVAMRSLTGDPARHRIVDLLVRARLVTTDEDGVELAHEALARAWPRLRSWLDDDAAGQRVLRHLSAAADGWESLGRPASELYRGARLEAALEWRAATHPDLTDLENAFVDASVAEAASARVALAERARHQARQNRRLRLLLGAGAAFLVLSLAAGLVAVGQRDRAQRSAADADAAADVAEARRLSALGLTADDLDQALLLAVEGRRLHDSNDTRTNLLASLNRRPQAIGVLRHPAIGAHGDFAVTADGRYLAAHDGGSLAFFDTATLQAAAEAPPESTFFRAIAPMADGRGVAAVVYPDDQSRGAVRFFDAATGTETREPLALTVPPLEGFLPAVSVALSGDGRYLAVGNQRNPDFPDDPASELVWDLRSPGSRPRTVTNGLDYPSLAFTPDNQLVIVGESTEAGAGLTLVDPATGDVVQTIPEARAPVAVSPDGGSVAAREGDALAIFDIATGARRRVLTRTSRPVAVAFSPDGRTLVSATDQPIIEVWDPASGERTGVLAGHSASAGAIGFGADGNTLYSSGTDGTVIAWDLAGDRRLVRQIAPPDRTPDSLKTHVAPSPDGTRLSYLYGDQIGVDHFAVRDVGSGPIGPERPSDHPFAGWQDWTPDGRRLVTVGNDRTARLWDPATGGLIAERRLPFDSTSGSVGWRPGGDTIFLGLHAGGIVELDAATLDVVGEPLRFDRYVSNVDVSPDERLLAVELFNPDALVLVDNETREVLATFDDVDAHWQLDFSPDGSLLAAGGTDGLVTLIDPVGQRTVGAPLRGVDGPVVSQSFSPDGSHLVTSSTDGTVQLWDVAARERVARVTPGEPRHEVFAWFEDGGRTIVAADERGGIWSIPSDPDEWQRRACEIAGRNLTREEWAELLPDQPYRKTCPAHPGGT